MTGEVWPFILAGIAGGVLGGMGLGGGTLLIPLLTIFLSVPRETAAWYNLVSFIPMSVVALIVHAKKKLVSRRDVLSVAPTAAVSAVAAAFFAGRISADILRASFGYFLIITGAFSLVFSLVMRYKKSREKKGNRYYINGIFHK